MMKPILLCALLACAAPALAGKKQAPDWSASLPAAPEPAPANGAIFQAGHGYAPLHAGTRAARVGDPLTILLVERTTTAKTVSSKTDKSGDIGLNPPATGPFSFLSPEALKASGNLSFNGQGNAGQTNSLSSTLSVTIAEVRPNGTALVRGEKRMLLSQGREWIRFSGIVRLADVSIDNTVPSTRVADAMIEYAGKGALQRSSKPGWLSQFFSFVNPF
jgi:flagellar L-ring protein precursor FlgH